MLTQLALDFSSWRIVERVSRKARRIRIEIRTADEVLLVIPHRASRREAHAFLQSRTSWIQRKLSQLRQRSPTPPTVPLRWEAAELKTLKNNARAEAQRLMAIEAPRLGVRPAGLRIADQRTLWGSCGASGRISLNWRLVLAPPEVLRYVVIHELAHLVHRNHSARFWNLVERQMPDFAIARRWLREHGSQLHGAGNT